MARIVLAAVLAGLPDAFAFVAPCRHTRPTALAGAKTDAVLGLLRRVPLVKRAVPKKRQPVKYVPPITVDAQPDVVDLIDAVATESEGVLEAVVQSLVDRGVAVQFEAPEPTPAPAPAPPPPDPISKFDALHAAGDVDALLAQLRDASRDSGGVDDAIEWRYARACLDASNALAEAAPAREGLVMEGLEAAKRAAALAPEDGLCQKWLGVMLGSAGDFQSPKEKIKNSYAIKEALDAAWRLRPEDGTVALALGQWCLKVASVSFVERGLARAIFGGSPPESSLAEALKFFTKAQELKPAPKTKALIRLVEKKMG